MKEIIAKFRGYLFILKTRYLSRNISVGAGMKMYCKLDIQGKGSVSIGKNCVVSNVRGDIRQWVTIYTHSPSAVVIIGDNVKLFAARISSKFEIIIGDNCLIEESGIMDTDFHSISADRGDPKENKERCSVHISNRVSIGSRSVVCKGSTIGDDVVIYPGTIVNKNVPAKATICGNPARIIRNVLT